MNCSASVWSVSGAGSTQPATSIHEFSIMSVSKPFVFALICKLIGAGRRRARSWGQRHGISAFNSVAAIERTSDGRTNPMVNAGAIATTSPVPGATHEAKWKFIHEGLSNFAGRKLPMNEEVLQSALDTNFRNRSIAQFLLSVSQIYSYRRRRWISTRGNVRSMSAPGILPSWAQPWPTAA